MPEVRPMDIKKWTEWVSALKSQIYALTLAAKDPETPLLSKILIMSVVAYALSPIDLIPDFIPILGYLDDLILLPLGIVLAIKLIPDEVWKRCCDQAKFKTETLKHSRIAGFLIVCVWIIGVVWSVRFVLDRML
ncbi:MAG: DUF1232 domain-containing protein [SAR324 cluster bacterium]|nr:DUF1232 domain-containing protein [SAR324 cluster bacterium]